MGTGSSVAMSACRITTCQGKLQPSVVTFLLESTHLVFVELERGLGKFLGIRGTDPVLVAVSSTLAAPVEDLEDSVHSV